MILILYKANRYNVKNIFVRLSSKKAHSMHAHAQIYN
jgi:hypothetical protein